MEHFKDNSGCSGPKKSEIFWNNSRKVQYYLAGVMHNHIAVFMCDVHHLTFILACRSTRNKTSSYHSVLLKSEKKWTLGSF